MDKISGAKSVIPAQAGVILVSLGHTTIQASNTCAGGGDPDDLQERVIDLESYPHTRG